MKCQCIAENKGMSFLFQIQFMTQYVISVQLCLYFCVISIYKNVVKNLKSVKIKWKKWRQ